MSAVLIAFAVLAVAFAGFCLLDIVRAEQVRYLPKWAWALVCVASIPLGGIVYLTAGRQSAGAGTLAPVRDPTLPAPETSRAETVSLPTPPVEPIARAATIQVEGLSKHFGTVVAVDDLSAVVPRFNIWPGTVCAGNQRAVC